MKMTWRRVATVLALVVLGPLEGCHDRPSPFDYVVQTLIDPPPQPVVSDPQESVAGSAPVAPGAAREGSAGEAVYVSLPSGTIPNGGFATIRDVRTGAEAVAAMDEGGFDPVPLIAAVGDVVTITATLEGGGSQLLQLVVPVRRKPVVVRVNPPPRKRDVPLNSTVVVVFSEPIRATSGPSIRVLANGSPVSGTTIITADGLRAEFRSTGLLSANTDYVLSVGAGVTDLSGDQMGTSVTTVFTTGTTIIAASVATDPVALFTNPYIGALRTFEMRAIRDADGTVSGTFSGFYPQTGVRWSGRVTCFSIVGGDSAWVGGVIETLSTPGDTSGVIGKDALWRMVDNGTPSPAVHDQLSLLDPGFETGTAQEWCANTPPDFPPPDPEPSELFDVQSGNIVVNPSGGPPPPPPPPPPPLPPDANRISQIAFWSPYEAILAISSDGADLRPVTGGPHDQNPAWSPNGRKIAFQSDRFSQNDWDIYVVNWDGSGLQQLTSGPGRDQDPAWSPDGQKIAFARSGSIHVMNANGTGLTRLSFVCCDSHPSWSPDGLRIVFASSRTGVNAIHVMNASGTNVVQLTSDSAIDYSPSWSPDGATIAFQRYLAAGYGWPWVYSMNPDGTGLKRLAGGGSPTWSPDGSRILFELFSMTSMLSDGSGMKRIGQGFSPSWSLGKMPPETAPFRSIELMGGDGQADTMLAVLPESLSVRVVGDDGSPQAGAVIKWDMLFDGPETGLPTLSGHMVPTNAAGFSSVQMRLGSGQPVVHVRAALLDGTARKAEVVFIETAVPKP